MCTAAHPPQEEEGGQLYTGYINPYLFSTELSSRRQISHQNEWSYRVYDYGTSFCTGSKILIWYSNQNKLVLVWLVMVWNLVLVSCKQSYTGPWEGMNLKPVLCKPPLVSVTQLNRQTWCPVVSPDFHGGWGTSLMVGEGRQQNTKLLWGYILVLFCTIFWQWVNQRKKSGAFWVEYAVVTS